MLDYMVKFPLCRGTHLDLQELRTPVFIQMFVRFSLQKTIQLLGYPQRLKGAEDPDGFPHGLGQVTRRKCLSRASSERPDKCQMNSELLLRSGENFRAPGYDEICI